MTVVAGWMVTSVGSTPTCCAKSGDTRGQFTGGAAADQNVKVVDPASDQKGAEGYAKSDVESVFRRVTGRAGTT